jgi:hypothetical protein
MRRTLSLGALLTLLLTGCGHVNHLARYPVQGSTMLFTSRVHPEALGTDVEIASPVSSHDTSTPKPVRWMVEIARAAGESFTEAAAYDKLFSALNAEELAEAASAAFRKAAQTYLRVRPVSSLEESPEFLAETVLEQYRLTATASGVFARVKVRSRIIHRPSGTVVWDNAEAETIPLQRTTGAAITGAVVPAAATTASILNVSRLLSLEPEQLRAIFRNASEQVGTLVGETLREDVSKLPRAGY